MRFVYLRPLNPATKGHIALLAAQIIYALNYSIAKDLMPHFMQPMSIVFYRILGAAVLFWLLTLVTGRQKVSRQDLLKMSWLAVFGVVVNQIFFICGLNYTTPINSSIIMISNPVLVFMFSLLVLRERITGIQVSGLVLAITGAMTLLAFRGNFQMGSDTVTGDLMTLINSTSWAIFIVSAKPIMVKYNTVTAMSWIFLFGSLYMLPVGAIAGVQTDFSHFTTDAWFALIFIVVATTFLAYLMNLYGLQMLSANTVSAYIYLQPFLATFFAILLGKDIVTPTKIFSGILIISGLYLVNRKSIKNRLAT
jgi:drug/metabolite transporter (DMT)-like permease